MVKKLLTLSMLVMLIIGVSALEQVVNAYNTASYKGKTVRWKNKKIRWRAGKNSFPYGHSRRTALVTANGRWNQAPGRFTYLTPTWGDSSVGRDNGETNFWFSSNQDILDGAPAMALYWYNGNAEIVEADVIFDNGRLWSTVTDYQFTKKAYGGDWRSFGSTALHEEGHALGLGHVNYTMNIMGSDQTHIMANDRKVRFYVGEDAGVGERVLYGGTQNTYKNDLGVSHWKYGSASGEYSRQILTKMYYLSNPSAVVSNTDFQGTLRYNVKKNTTYYVQFTYENNGRYKITNIDIAFYISTNDRITTLDQKIASYVFGQLVTDTVYTRKLRVYIPGNLVEGQTYWLGVVIDYKNKVPEFSGFNNATYIPIKIVP